MKALNLPVFVLLLSVLSSSTGHADVIIDSINYKITLGEFSGPPNSTVKMPVKLKNVVAIGGFMLRIEYDTSLLSLVEIGSDVGTLLYDSLELVDRGLNTMLIDSISGIPPWDTVFSTYAIHDSGDDSINTEAMFIRFIPPMPPADTNLRRLWGTPHLPINTDDPSAILDLLFTVDPGAIPGQTAMIYVKNYTDTGQYSEYRNVQFTDTTGILTIFPGNGPVFASGFFIVNPVFCGDVNAAGAVNLLDITYLISYLYRDGAAPNPMEAADVNSSGSINLLDITYLIAYLYQGGPEPVCP